jgi:hypothetical protein
MERFFVRSHQFVRALSHTALLTPCPWRDCADRGPLADPICVCQRTDQFQLRRTLAVGTRSMTMSNDAIETGWQRFLDRLKQLWGRSRREDLTPMRPAMAFAEPAVTHAL